MEKLYKGPLKDVPDKNAIYLVTDGPVFKGTIIFIPRGLLPDASYFRLNPSDSGTWHVFSAIRGGSCWETEEVEEIDLSSLGKSI